MYKFTGCTLEAFITSTLLTGFNKFQSFIQNKSNKQFSGVFVNCATVTMECYVSKNLTLDSTKILVALTREVFYHTGKAIVTQSKLQKRSKFGIHIGYSTWNCSYLITAQYTSWSCTNKRARANRRFQRDVHSNFHRILINQLVNKRIFAQYTAILHKTLNWIIKTFLQCVDIRVNIKPDQAKLNNRLKVLIQNL